MKELEILFEDANVLVLNKPAGLLSQGDHSGDESVVSRMQAYLGRPYVGLVHRLDRNTSGVMVIAKRTKAAERLTRSLQSGELERTYLACCEGVIEGPKIFTHYLIKNESTNQVRCFREPRKDAKEAILQLEPVRHAQIAGIKVTWVQVQLETGRSHQIRAQLQCEGHPLIGDSKYGNGPRGTWARPALHSWKISFPHPITRERIECEAELVEK